MSVMTPTQSISADPDRAEIHFTIGGYWDLAGMKQFLFDLGEAAKPLMKRGEPFGALGDLREFMPQDRENQQRHSRQHQRGHPQRLAALCRFVGLSAGADAISQDCAIG